MCIRDSPNVEANFTESAMEVDYIRIYQDQTTDINELEKESITVYPNPTDGQLYIDLDKEFNTKVEVKIFNSNGGLFSHTEENLNGRLLRLTHLENAVNGSYYILLEIDSELFSYKVVKR